MMRNVDGQLLLCCGCKQLFSKLDNQVVRLYCGHYICCKCLQIQWIDSGRNDSELVNCILCSSKSKVLYSMDSLNAEHLRSVKIAPKPDILHEGEFSKTYIQKQFMPCLDVFSQKQDSVNNNLQTADSWCLRMNNKDVEMCLTEHENNSVIVQTPNLKVDGHPIYDYEIGKSDIVNQNSKIFSRQIKVPGIQEHNLLCSETVNNEISSSVFKKSLISKPKKIGTRRSKSDSFVHSNQREILKSFRPSIANVIRSQSSQCIRKENQKQLQQQINSRNTSDELETGYSTLHLEGLGDKEIMLDSYTCYSSPVSVDGEVLQSWLSGCDGSCMDSCDEPKLIICESINNVEGNTSYSNKQFTHLGATEERIQLNTRGNCEDLYTENQRSCFALSEQLKEIQESHKPVIEEMQGKHRKQEGINAVFEPVVSKTKLYQPYLEDVSEDEDMSSEMSKVKRSHSVKMKELQESIVVEHSGDKYEPLASSDCNDNSLYLEPLSGEEDAGQHSLYKSCLDIDDGALSDSTQIYLDLDDTDWKDSPYKSNAQEKTDQRLSESKTEYLCSCKNFNLCALPVGKESCTVNCCCFRDDQNSNGKNQNCTTKLFDFLWKECRPGFPEAGAAGESDCDCLSLSDLAFLKERLDLIVSSVKNSTMNMCIRKALIDIIHLIMSCVMLAATAVQHVDYCKEFFDETDKHSSINSLNNLKDILKKFVEQGVMVSNMACNICEQSEKPCCHRKEDDETNLVTNPEKKKGCDETQNITNRTGISTFPMTSDVQSKSDNSKKFKTSVDNQSTGDCHEEKGNISVITCGGQRHLLPELSSDIHLSKNDFNETVNSSECGVCLQTSPSAEPSSKNAHLKSYTQNDSVNLEDSADQFQFQSAVSDLPPLSKLPCRIRLIKYLSAPCTFIKSSNLNCNNELIKSDPRTKNLSESIEISDIHSSKKQGKEKTDNGGDNEQIVHQQRKILESLKKGPNYDTHSEMNVVPDDSGMIGSNEILVNMTNETKQKQTVEINNNFERNFMNRFTLQDMRSNRNEKSDVSVIKYMGFPVHTNNNTLTVDDISSLKTENKEQKLLRNTSLEHILKSVSSDRVDIPGNSTGLGFKQQTLISTSAVECGHDEHYLKEKSDNGVEVFNIPYGVEKNSNTTKENVGKTCDNLLERTDVSNEGASGDSVAQIERLSEHLKMARKDEAIEIKRLDNSGNSETPLISYSDRNSHNMQEIVGEEYSVDKLMGVVSDHSLQEIEVQHPKKKSTTSFSDQNRKSNEKSNSANSNKDQHENSMSNVSSETQSQNYFKHSDSLNNKNINPPRKDPQRKKQANIEVVHNSKEENCSIEFPHKKEMPSSHTFNEDGKYSRNDLSVSREKNRNQNDKKDKLPDNSSNTPTSDSIAGGSKKAGTECAKISSQRKKLKDEISVKHNINNYRPINNSDQKCCKRKDDLDIENNCKQLNGNSNISRDNLTSESNLSSNKFNSLKNKSAEHVRNIYPCSSQNDITFDKMVVPEKEKDENASLTSSTKSSVDIGHSSCGSNSEKVEGQNAENIPMLKTSTPLNKNLDLVKTMLDKLKLKFSPVMKSLIQSRGVEGTQVCELDLKESIDKKLLKDQRPKVHLSDDRTHRKHSASVEKKHGKSSSSKMSKQDITCGEKIPGKDTAIGDKRRLITELGSNKSGKIESSASPCKIRKIENQTNHSQTLKPPASKYHSSCCGEVSQIGCDFTKASSSKTGSVKDKSGGGKNQLLGSHKKDITNTSHRSTMEKCDEVTKKNHRTSHGHDSSRGKFEVIATTPHGRSVAIQVMISRESKLASKTPGSCSKNQVSHSSKDSSSHQKKVPSMSSHKTDNKCSTTDADCPLSNGTLYTKGTSKSVSDVGTNINQDTTKIRNIEFYPDTSNQQVFCTKLCKSSNQKVSSTDTAQSREKSKKIEDKSVSSKQLSNRNSSTRSSLNNHHVSVRHDEKLPSSKQLSHKHSHKSSSTNQQMSSRNDKSSSKLLSSKDENKLSSNKQIPNRNDKSSSIEHLSHKKEEKSSINQFNGSHKGSSCKQLYHKSDDKSCSNKHCTEDHADKSPSVKQLCNSLVDNSSSNNMSNDCAHESVLSDQRSPTTSFYHRMSHLTIIESAANLNQYKGTEDETSISISSKVCSVSSCENLPKTELNKPCIQKCSHSNVGKSSDCIDSSSYKASSSSHKLAQRNVDKYFTRHNRMSENKENCEADMTLSHLEMFKGSSENADILNGKEVVTDDLSFQSIMTESSSEDEGQFEPSFCGISRFSPLTVKVEKYQDDEIELPTLALPCKRRSLRQNYGKKKRCHRVDIDTHREIHKILACDSSNDNPDIATSENNGDCDSHVYDLYETMDGSESGRSGKKYKHKRRSRLHTSLSSSSSEEIIPESRKRGFKFTKECFQILDDVYNHKMSEPFRHEVRSKNVPGYYVVVKRGMAYDMMAHKLRDNIYVDLSDFISDMQLIFSNCRLFHKEGSPIYEAGQTMEKYFEKKFKEIFPEELLFHLGRNSSSTSLSHQ